MEECKRLAGGFINANGATGEMTDAQNEVATDPVIKLKRQIRDITRMDICPAKALLLVTLLVAPSVFGDDPQAISY